MAGKRKSKADAWMPPRVYRGKSSYEYRPQNAKAETLFKLPKDGVEPPSLQSKVWAAYAKLKDAPPQFDDISKLIAEYHRSPQFHELAYRTKIDYERYSKTTLKVFGHMVPHDIIPLDIRNFMDAMAQQLNKDGNPKTSTANKHHSYLSTLFSWGLERNWLPTNPAKNVKKFKEKPRDRYIEDWEYNLVLQCARESAYPYIAPMMELSYLCRARSKEVRMLTELDILDEGIFWTE